MQKYVRIERGCVYVNPGKIDFETRFYGKCVLTTDTNLPVEEVALKVKGNVGGGGCL